MNIINIVKISKITALSALVFVFGAVAFVAPQAHASTYGGNYGYNSGYGHGGGSYYGGNSYYPTGYPSTGHNTSSSASSASASSASNNTTVTVSNPVTVTVPVTVVGGAGYTPVYAPVSTPIYPTSPVVYNYPSYTPTYYGNNYAQLGGSCYAQTTNASVGQNITWIANAYGGNGNNYTYSWSGTGGMYGYGPTISYAYNTSGTMVANVTITSDGQSISVPCNSDIIVNGYNYNGGYNYNNYYPTPVPVYAPVYNGPVPTPINNGLTIGCAADAATVREGVPVTWSVEVTGGSGQYTYAWSGTGSLAGSQSSVATAYETPGQKEAVVIVTSSNGMTGSKSCTPVTVIGNGGNGNGGTVTPAPVNPNANNSGLSAASLFSLSNIPWGWVAVLVILVLFGTVMYMLFNKNKI